MSSVLKWHLLILTLLCNPYFEMAHVDFNLALQAIIMTNCCVTVECSEHGPVVIVVAMFAVH